MSKFSRYLEAFEGLGKKIKNIPVHKKIKSFEPKLTKLQHFSNQIILTLNSQNHMMSSGKLTTYVCNRITWIITVFGGGIYIGSSRMAEVWLTGAGMAVVYVGQG